MEAPITSEHVSLHFTARPTPGKHTEHPLHPALSLSQPTSLIPISVTHNIHASGHFSNTSVQLATITQPHLQPTPQAGMATRRHRVNGHALQPGRANGSEVSCRPSCTAAAAGGTGCPASSGALSLPLIVSQVLLQMVVLQNLILCGKIK